MGITDYGTQNILGRYMTPLSGLNFGNLTNALRPGIYSGLIPSRISATEIQISPGVFEILDSSAGSQVRIETSVNITPWAVDETKPYIIFRWVYADTTEWYADLMNASFAELLPNDVILGKCQFSGRVLLPSPNTFNFNSRTDARYCKIETYELDGVKDGSNLIFTLPTNFPEIREDQWYISYNGAMIFKDVSYTVSDETTSGREITLTVDPPQSVDDLRVVVISH